MNLTRYNETCNILERRGYGSDAVRVLDEMVKVDRVVQGRFKIERTLERDGLIPMTVTYDSTFGWSCRTHWIAYASVQDRASSI